MKKIIYFLILLISVSGIKAQSVFKNQLLIKKQSITRSKDNRLTIAMDIVMQANLKIPSNNVATFTPLLQTTGYNKSLPAVAVYGRRRAMADERNKKLPQNAYAIVRRKNDTEQIINYLIQIPYEKWMNRAELTLSTNLRGCCDLIEKEPSSDLIVQLQIEPDPIHPSIAYITPKAEAVKHRAAVGKAYLDFPVNQTVINPDFRNNQQELAKIRATIDTVRNDRNTSITQIVIEGYASPEGKYASNALLAQGRAEALMNYVRNTYDFPQNLLEVNSTPEDWIGFRKFIESSSLAQKQTILQIIDSDEKDMDVKEKQIARIAGPDTYRMLLTQCYPTLRHSDYTVSYTVRGFNIDEAKEIIKNHPQQLSLQEIFNVAQSYPKGSEGFNHAFQVAVMMFPNNTTANLNAAAMEIQKGGDMTTAKKYLSKADPESGATLNNLGVIAIQEGNLDAAEQYFKQAQKAGSKEAIANLEEIAKQRN